MPAHEAWGLDIGQSGLHAVKIARTKGGGAQVTDVFFAPIHAEFEDAQYDQRVGEALQRLMTEKNVGKTPVVASLPGFSTLFREFDLPAVSDSKLSEIVSYEARQKIPYPLEDVIWDYHKMRVDEDTGELGMALLCCRKDIVATLLEQLDSAGFNVDAIQVGPVALMNYVMFDQEPEEPVLILDTGSRSTDFIVINDDTFWLRSIGVSGADLSKALMAKFSITQDKADELKLEVGQSRQGERVFRILEPVLRNLCNEVQRSIGFYKSLYRGARIGEILCAGNTFLLSGIDQFVADNVGLATRTLDTPVRVEVNLADQAAEVTENRQVFGTAAGLALQGIGLAPVEMTLLPPERRQQKMIQEKLPFGLAAVALIALTVGISFLMAGDQSASYRPTMEEAKKTHNKAEAARRRYTEKLDLFKPEKEKSTQLANLPERRGNMIAADAAVMAVIADLNDKRFERITPNEKRMIDSKQKIETNALLKKARKSFPAPKAEKGVSEEDHARITENWDKDLVSQVAYIIEWRYSRYRRVFIDESRFSCVQAIVKKNPSAAANVAKHKIIDEKKTTALNATDGDDDDDDDADGGDDDDGGDRKKREAAAWKRKANTREMVKVRLKGFVVGGSATDIAVIRKALLALPGQRSGKLNMNRTTQVDNSIRLPSVGQPIIKQTAQAGVGEMLQGKGSDGSGRNDGKMTFKSVEEKGRAGASSGVPLMGFDVTFYYEPKPFAPKGSVKRKKKL